MRSVRTLLGVAALLAATLPTTPAQAAPAIRFLNPSDYTANLVLSDEQDRDAAFHLVAWVKEVPASPLVEFELQPTTPGSSGATISAERVGNDTWEAFYPISTTFPDGAYDLVARLYNGQPGNAQEITNTTMRVTVNRDQVPPPPEAKTAEITYPDNGGPLGFFSPRGDLPNAVFDYLVSSGTEQVRALFTQSDPGNDPEWVECGTGDVPEGLGGKVRCTLTQGVNPLDVTAVAVVANRSVPPAPANAALDDTGDAHRVVPYAQTPATVLVSPESTTTALSDCKTHDVRVLDQRQRPIADLNVDVHAVGPDDQLRFGSVQNVTSGFKEPDAAHVGSREEALNCANEEESGWQGDHNVPLQDDIKHIESTAGTNNSGLFTYATFSQTIGGTNFTVWADTNDDDQPGSSEAVGGAQLGWGTAPPEPVQEIALTPADVSSTTNSCVAFEAVARRGGSLYSGANVDVHLAGPDSTVNFCDVSGGTGRQDPNGGGHLGSSHEDGTRHTEGQTDAGGRFVFGVTAASAGQTNVQIWIDQTEDDVFNGEPQRTGRVTWAPPGDRSITLESSKSTVRKGRRVQLFGRIEGDPSCAAAQLVQIQAKPLRGGSFATIKTVTTDADGDYATRVKMRKPRRFRSLVSIAGDCQEAISRTVTVRTRS